MRSMGNHLSRWFSQGLVISVLAISLPWVGSGASAAPTPGKKSQATVAKHRAHAYRGHRTRPGRHRVHVGVGYRGGYGYGRYGYYGYPYYWGSHYFGYPYYRHYYPGYRYGRDAGAVDLNIRPKKTSVYVDGQFVGKTGKFDGFPNYLWLPKGQYDLAFHHEGFRTVTKTIKVYPGMIIDLKMEMAPGESTPVKQITPSPREPEYRERRRERDTPDRYSHESAPRRYEPPPTRGPRERAGANPFDLREKPAVLHLRVAPADASIYLDGQFLGTSEVLRDSHEGILLDAGEHSLEVLRPGYETRVIEFQIKPGENRDLEVQLNPEEP